MTVASEAFFTDWFLADGVTKDWSYDFGIISSSHVRVLVRDGTDDTTVVEYNSGFSFFPAADYGSGVVRYPATGSALAVGKQVRILRQMDFLQSTEIGMEGSFAPILHERAFDKLTMQAQQLKEDAKRSMKAPLGATGYEFSSGFLDYQTFMKLGNLIVPGPTAAQIENAETNAEDAIAAKVAAEAARDLAAGYASSINPANFYTRGQIDGFRTTDQNAAKDAARLTTGTVPDARLPARLKAQAGLATDYNQLTEDGWYFAYDTAANSPASGVICVVHVSAGPSATMAVRQDAYETNTARHWRRYGYNSSGSLAWTSWQLVYETAAEIQSIVPALGVGQTWQNVLSSRSVDTVYQNTSGKPIVVAMNGWARYSFCEGQVSADNVTWLTPPRADNIITSDTTYYYAYPTFVVPVGHYYRLTRGSSFLGVISWFELR